MPESNIGSGGPVDRGGGLNLPQPSEVQQNDAIKKTEFPDEMTQAGIAANVSQSFGFGDAKSIQKQVKAAVDEQPHVPPAKGEPEQANELKNLEEESKKNPLFQGVALNRLTESIQQNRRVRSFSAITEMEFQIHAMKNELKLAKETGKKILQAAKQEFRSLRDQAITKFVIGGFVGAGAGYYTRNSGGGMATTGVVQAVDGASGSAIQANYVVAKAEKDAQREILGTYQKENERILQNAAEARQKENAEVPKMLDALRQMINELYRTFGKLGAHG